MPPVLPDAAADFNRSATRVRRELGGRRGTKPLRSLPLRDRCGAPTEDSPHLEGHQRQRRYVPKPRVGRGTRPTLGHPAPSDPNRNAVVARHGSGNWSLATGNSRTAFARNPPCPPPICIRTSHMRRAIATPPTRSVLLRLPTLAMATGLSRWFHSTFASREAAKIAKEATTSLSPTSAPLRLCAKTSPSHPPPDRKQPRAEAQGRREGKPLSFPPAFLRVFA
jgi:hypothetical protein